MNSYMNDHTIMLFSSSFFFERSLYMTKDLHSIKLKHDLCKLRYVHAVGGPMKSRTSGFQREVEFALAPYIAFVFINSCF